MDRQAQAQIEYRRFLTAFIKRNASLPTGSLLYMLDLLSRCQFMEGLAHIKFNTISARASTSKGNLIKAIGLLMQKVDPTADPSTSVWTQDGSSGLYKSAWLGANRIFSKTQSSATGVPLEATDLLSANMLQSLEHKPEEAMTPDELAVAIEGESDEKKKAILQQQQQAIHDLAIADAALGKGNFFYEAGKRFYPKREGIVRGEITVDDVGGLVARYAMNAAINAVDKRNTESKAQAKALKSEMLPSGDETGDFALDSLDMRGWNVITQFVGANPYHPFSQLLVDWMGDALAYTEMSPGKKAVIVPYINAVLNGEVTDDKSYAKSIGLDPSYFAQIKKEFTEGAYLLFKKDPPDFINEAENAVFLLNAQKGRGRFAKESPMHRTAAETILRSKLIRLAYAKPEFRAQLLPLLKQAAGEGPEAGRTWGAPDPHSRPDDNAPYNHHPDSPPAGADGSAQRKVYNKWFQENVCPGHKTLCGDPERFGR
jgi:hypothetical protein